MTATAKRAASKPFLDLTAADLMSAPLTTIPQDMPLRDAGHLLIKAHISGARWSTPRESASAFLPPPISSAGPKLAAKWRN